MGERNRYLRLDRQLAERTGRGGRTGHSDGNSRGGHTASGRDVRDRAAGDEGEAAWPGTVDRVPAAGPPEAWAGQSSWALAAFDDGTPIDLHHNSPPPQGESAEERAEGLPAGARRVEQYPVEQYPAEQPYPVEQPYPAEQPHPPSPSRSPSPPPAAVAGPPLGPAAPSHPDQAAAVPPDPSDLEFADRVRQLVEQAAAGGQPAGEGHPATTRAAPASPAHPGMPAPSAESAEPAAPDGESDRYAVFQSVADSLARPATFDLGSVSVADAFEALEAAIDREEGAAAHRAAKAAATAPAPPLAPFDVAEDFAMMPLQSAQSTPAPQWRDFAPAAADTVVLDGVEHPAPAGVVWRNWTAGGVTQHRDRSDQTSRALADIRQVVVHESAGANWRDLPKPKGVHLHIERDGTVIQHNDLVDLLWHAEPFSAHSVGVEFVNPVYDTDAAATPGEKPPGERIKVAWAPHDLGPYYTLPPAAQVEALALTVEMLRERLGVPDNWLQVIQHPDPAKKATMAGRWFYVLSTRGHQYFANAVKDPWTASHSALVSHEDGAFPTLYCYLRLHKRLAPADAYQLARQIVEDPGEQRRQTYHHAATKATLQMVDITDVV